VTQVDDRRGDDHVSANFDPAFALVFAAAQFALDADAHQRSQFVPGTQLDSVETTVDWLIPPRVAAWNVPALDDSSGNDPCWVEQLPN
jgi:hypothetical protein